MIGLAVGVLMHLSNVDSWSMSRVQTPDLASVGSNCGSNRADVLGHRLRRTGQLESASDGGGRSRTVWRGLQNRLHGFESRRRLHHSKHESGELADVLVRIGMAATGGTTGESCI